MILRRHDRRQVHARRRRPTSRPSAGDEQVAVRPRRRHPSSRIGAVASHVIRPIIRSLSRRHTASSRVGVAARGEAVGRPVEPQVHLPGAHRVLVLAVLAAGRGAVLLAEGADHHQVVAEPRLGLEAVEVRHRLQHPRVVARGEPGDPLAVGLAAASGVKMCSHAGGLVLAQLAQRPEGVAAARRRRSAAPCGRTRRSRRRARGRAAGCPRCRRSGRRRCEIQRLSGRPSPRNSQRLVVA